MQHPFWTIQALDFNLLQSCQPTVYVIACLACLRSSDPDIVAELAADGDGEPSCRLRPISSEHALFVNHPWRFETAIVCRPRRRPSISPRWILLDARRETSSSRLELSWEGQRVFPSAASFCSPVPDPKPARFSHHDTRLPCAIADDGVPITPTSSTSSSFVTFSAMSSYVYQLGLGDNTITSGNASSLGRVRKSVLVWPRAEECFRL